MRIVRDSIARLDLAPREVWVLYFGAGGTATAGQLTEWLSEGHQLPGREYDVLAQALDDEFRDRGLPDRLPHRP